MSVRTPTLPARPTPSFRWNRAAWATLLALAGADLATTAVGLEAGLAEANGVVTGLVGHSLLGFLGLTLVYLAGVWACYQLACRGPAWLATPWSRAAVLGTSLAIQAAVVLWNSHLLWRIGVVGA